MAEAERGGPDRDRCHWNVVSIDDLKSQAKSAIAIGPFGSRMKSDAYVERGVPVIRGKNISTGRPLVGEFVFVSDETADDLSSSNVLPDDLVFPHRGAIGEVGIVPRSGPARWMLSTSLMKLSVDRSKVDPLFLFYFFRSPAGRGELLRHSSNVGTPGIAQPLTSLRSITLPLPPISTQERIAEVLGTLDDLIENNRRRVAVLEEMAKALYSEWFVHLRYPGHEIATFVDSPLGPIPEGWEVKSLFDVADVGFGFSFKSKRFSDSGPFPVIRIRDVLAGTTTTFSDEEPTERYRVVDGDVLIGMDGDFHLQQWTGGDAWLNQRVTRVRPTSGLSARHLMLALTRPIKEWNSAITGTTVAHLGKRHLEQIHLTIPDRSVLQHATPAFNDHAALICKLLQTNRRLASLRELLLPKLVSGQIDVSSLDLDELVGEAVA